MRMSKWIGLSILIVSMNAVAEAWPERWIDHEPTHRRNQNAVTSDQDEPKPQASQQPAPVAREVGSLIRTVF